MTDNWFITRTVGKGTATDKQRPKYSRQTNGYSGHPIQNGKKYIVRFRGEKSTLKEISERDDVQELSGKQAEKRLNEVFNENRKINDWEDIFAVSGGSQQ